MALAGARANAFDSEDIDPRPTPLHATIFSCNVVMFTRHMQRFTGNGGRSTILQSTNMQHFQSLVYMGVHACETVGFRAGSSRRRGGDSWYGSMGVL